MKRWLIIAGFLVLLAVLIAKRGRPLPEIHGSAMGCRWTLEWRGQAPPWEMLNAEISATLEKWEQVLSQWRPESDLSKFNRGESPSSDLERVMAMAEELKRESGGAFDHQLLEKVHAAGFGPAGSGVDLSSLGKGFAVDRVCERLKELGLTDFVFALAGEVRASGGAWPVAIEKPEPGGAAILRTEMIENQSIATSGNYRQFRQGDGGLESHIIDPKSGKSVIRPPCSVTVRAEDCARASAWATAIFVLGPDFRDFPADLEVRWQP